MQDEKAFYPNFLEGCSDMELVGLQHDLRMHPDDKPYLDQVLQELKRRSLIPPAPASQEDSQ